MLGYDFVSDSSQIEPVPCVKASPNLARDTGKRCDLNHGYLYSASFDRYGPQAAGFVAVSAVRVLALEDEHSPNR